MGNIVTDTTIYTGKPENTNRLKKELDSYELLDKLGISYFRLDHDEAMSVDDCLEVEELLDIQIYKNLFLCNSSKNEFYLLTMPGNKRFDTKIVSKQVDSSRLSFAGPEYLEEYLNLQPGSVSILGLMFDKDRKVKLLIDKDLLTDEYFGCHPCVNTSSLKIKTKDLLEKFLPYTGHSPLFVEL